MNDRRDVLDSGDAVTVPHGDAFAGNWMSTDDVGTIVVVLGGIVSGLSATIQESNDGSAVVYQGNPFVASGLSDGGYRATAQPGAAYVRLRVTNTDTADHDISYSVRALPV